MLFVFRMLPSLLLGMAASAAAQTALIKARVTIRIMLSAPFALVGGIFLQWQQGFSMTTAVIIGYVSLFAVAIQTGIIMIEFIREALAHRTSGPDLAIGEDIRRRQPGPSAA